MPGKINGFSLAYTTAGGIVLWSGIRGWTISETFKNLLSGKTPSGQSEPISSTQTDINSGTSIPGVTVGIPAGIAAPSSLQSLWTSNGGASNTAAFAAAVAQAESSGSATVTSSNPDGGTNVGIWQLDTRGVGAGYTVAQLQNANTNARITVMATANGTNWSSWDDPVVNALPGKHYTPGSAVP
jgi:hypothetical protein